MQDQSRNFESLRIPERTTGEALGHVAEPMVKFDAERGSQVAELLYRAFSTTGIHGRKDMPEDVRPVGVLAGSLEHILFMTLTVSIDYQRDAGALWDSARRTFEDGETRYLFDPAALHEKPWRKVQGDMSRYGLSKKFTKDCNVWRTVGITFFKKWGADPRNFLADCGWDAPKILERLARDTHLNNGRSMPDYPYLRGKKIGPLWLRMLRDNVGLEIRNLEWVPIPVDVHVARASLSIGLIKGHYGGNLEQIYQTIREAWRKSVHGLRVTDRSMIALDVDEPLWHLSKYGCRDRDQKVGSCPHYGKCEARDFCVRGKVVIANGQVIMET